MSLLPGSAEEWQYQPPDGAPLHIRALPALDAQRTGSTLTSGESFRVAEVRSGPDGISFLRLADGRGWAFDQKPAQDSNSSWGSWLGCSSPQNMVLCVPRPASLSPGAALPTLSTPGNQATSGNVAQSASGELRVRVLAAHGLLNTDVGGFFGNKSDPYVAVRFGNVEKKTPVINDNLDPVWTQSRDFTFQIPQEPGNAVLELEVFNSNTFTDDTLGLTTLPLSQIPRGQWHRQVAKLKSRSTVAPAQGDLEYEVCIGKGASPVTSSSASSAAAATSSAAAITSTTASHPALHSGAHVSTFSSSGLATQAVASSSSAHSLSFPGVPASPSVLPAPLPGELKPGKFRIVRSAAVHTRAEGCSDRDIVGYVREGDDVEVLEVFQSHAEQRLRGLIGTPRGWIPLLDTHDGLHWVSVSPERRYLVDSSGIGASRGGLAYRHSKNVEDRDERPGELGGPPWGSQIFAVDEGDGWVRVKDGRYLPKSVNGVPVLILCDGSPTWETLRVHKPSSPARYNDGFSAGLSAGYLPAAQQERAYIPTFEGLPSFESPGLRADASPGNGRRDFGSGSFDELPSGLQADALPGVASRDFGSRKLQYPGLGLGPTTAAEKELDSLYSELDRRMGLSPGTSASKVGLSSPSLRSPLSQLDFGASPGTWRSSSRRSEY